MTGYQYFQDHMFQEIEQLERDHRRKVLEEFVERAEACGFTIDELIEINSGSPDGADFLRRFRANATARGVRIVSD